MSGFSQKCLILLLITPFSVMAEQADVRAAKDWVDSHAPDCTLTDGYVCGEFIEDDFVTRHDSRLSVPGNYLLAWETAWRDFRQLPDLDEKRKALKHYRIGFTENADEYIVLFDALLLPAIDDNGQPNGILTVTYGRSTKYWIDRKTLRINKRLYLK
ncbi:MAG: hypothetical protein DSZ32_02550 [Gammaproteobacteria bacterium]|nr:MAG: hypothetical protein DSZ33_06230 [Gammaproteobacteria bacterium]RTZ61063.1 MAG: hypothetical protein DSZ32_02550 [Gammaproteobacteria bacterium]